jgi:hypothetical protein
LFPLAYLLKLCEQDFADRSRWCCKVAKELPDEVGHGARAVVAQHEGCVRFAHVAVQRNHVSSDFSRQIFNPPNLFPPNLFTRNIFTPNLFTPIFSPLFSPAKLFNLPPFDLATLKLQSPLGGRRRRYHSTTPPGLLPNSFYIPLFKGPFKMGFLSYYAQLTLAPRLGVSVFSDLLKLTSRGEL